MISENNHQHYLSVPGMIRHFDQISDTGSSRSLPITLDNDLHSSSLISSASQSTRTGYGCSVHDSIDELHGPMELQTESPTRLVTESSLSPQNGHCASGIDLTISSSQVNVLNSNDFDQEGTPSNDQREQSQSLDPSANIEMDGKDQLTGPLPLPTKASRPSRDLYLLRWRTRSLPIGNFLKEIGALLVVCTLCMVLVLAIREDQFNLRIAMQVCASLSSSAFLG